MTWRLGTGVFDVFADRVDAGRRLATRVQALEVDRPVALGLPRGGVPVAAEVSQSLRCPLDVLIVRKLGTPGRPELALGAIGEGDVRITNDDLIRRLGIDPSLVDEIERRERVEVERRTSLYRAGRERIDIEGHTAVVIDDGVATGATALAGCQVARAMGASRVVLAVPVAPADWHPGADADDFVTVIRPRVMRAVGEWYTDFTQTPDTMVIQLLAAHTDSDTGTAGRPDDAPS